MNLRREWTEGCWVSRNQLQDHMQDNFQEWCAGPQLSDRFGGWLNGHKIQNGCDETRERRGRNLANKRGVLVGKVKYARQCNNAHLLRGDGVRFLEPSQRPPHSQPATISRPTAKIPIRLRTKGSHPRRTSHCPASTVAFTSTTPVHRPSKLLSCNRLPRRVLSLWI